LYKLVNKKKPGAQFFFLYVYFYSLHVSANYVPVIRGNNCINATPGICRSVWMTVWYAGSHPAYQTACRTATNTE